MFPRFYYAESKKKNYTEETVIIILQIVIIFANDYGYAVITNIRLRQGRHFGRTGITIALIFSAGTQYYVLFVGRVNVTQYYNNMYGT